MPHPSMTTQQIKNVLCISVNDGKANAFSTPLLVALSISTEFLINQNKPMTVSANQGESIVDIISFSSISNFNY